LEPPFLVDAVLALDALLVAVPPVTPFLALPRPVLDLTFFSGATFLPAYVFFEAASVFFVADGLTAGLAGFEVVVGLLTVLVDGLVAGVFEDGALRPVEGLVAVVVLAVEVLDFDAGFVAGFEAVLVVVGFEVFEVGLFSFASSLALVVFGASFTRPDGPLGRWKTPFSAPTAIALLSCVF